MKVVVVDYQEAIESRQVQRDCWIHNPLVGLALLVVAAIAVVAVVASILLAVAVVLAASFAGACILPAVAAASSVRGMANYQLDLDPVFDLAYIVRGVLRLKLLLVHSGLLTEQVDLRLLLSILIV